MRASLGDDIPLNDDFPPLPTVMDNYVLAPYYQQKMLENGSAHNPLELLLKTEYLMQNNGFDSRILEYEASGEEAVVFRLKGVDDVLLKVSLGITVPRTVFYNVRADRIVVHGDPSNVQKERNVSVAINTKA